MLLLTINSTDHPDFPGILQAIAAIVNIVFIVIVFLYQYKNDKKNKSFQLEVQHLAFDRERFNSIFIQNSLRPILLFSDQLIQKINSTDSTEPIKQDKIDEISDMFNLFEFETISLFDAVEQKLYNDVENEIDKLRESIMFSLSSCTINKYSLRISIVSTRNNILSAIYNTTPPNSN